jgi:acetyl-CoA acetyltransferase
MSPQPESIYIVEGKRSPFGKFGGSFIDCSFIDLLLPPTEELIKNITGHQK